MDSHNYLLMMYILRGLYEHERLKPAIIGTSQGNIYNLPELNQVVNIGYGGVTKKDLIITIICRDRYILLLLTFIETMR